MTTRANIFAIEARALRRRKRTVGKKMIPDRLCLHALFRDELCVIKSTMRPLLIGAVIVPPPIP